MTFPFNLRKTIQAVGVVLDADDRRVMDYIRLLKLLYIADREAILETGRPIIGSRVVALKNGPLHSRVYNLIEGEDVAKAEWAQFFRTEHDYICRIGEPGVDSLSRYEIRKLREVEQRFQDCDTWQLVESTHEFPEWKMNYPDPSENTSRVIPLQDVIEAVGGSIDAYEILQDVEEAEAIEKLLG